MNAGIDFGTSTCSIGVWSNGQPILLKLEDASPLMPSALYTSKSNIPLYEIDKSELKKRVKIAKGRQTKETNEAAKNGYSIKIISDEDLENYELGIMRRELAEAANKKYESQSIKHALYSDSETLFGDAAVKRHLSTPQEGFFIKSPKSFLGADIKNHHIELFSEIITKMLAHIKQSAENQTENDISKIVLGRPINFHATRGDIGNKQAIGILERSAIAAGFKEVEFLYEPIAAAFDYERSLISDLVVLIIDIGGGTTDCSMLKVGPSFRRQSDRDNSILGYAGTQIGGMNIDIKLAIRKIMPYFGKDSLKTNGLPIPSSIFCNAASINDVNAQTAFYSPSSLNAINKLRSEAIDKQKIERLNILYNGRLSYRLNRSAELAKIHLSAREYINLPLRYIEPNLVINLSSQDLKDSIENELATIISLMKEVTTQGGQIPDVIYVTGGTSKSPLIQEYIRANFKDSEIVIGDLFGGVTSGLTTWANRIF